MEKVAFYWEWLPLPKAEFNVLTMIADHGGAFSGNYAEMCRYLNVTTQDSNRKVLQRAIESLATKGFITWETSGRTQKLNIIPKEKEVCLPCEWVRSVIRHDYTSESVAFAQVLKLFMWIVHNNQEVVTNEMIAKDMGVSVSTVVSAKNVLDREYENITRRKRSEKIGVDSFRTIGQELAASAWWNEL